MLERLPSLSPWQVREALRMTASQAEYPDNDYGWGIVDAQAAINYWGPVIEHEPLGYTDQASLPRTVTARVTSRQGVDSQSVILSWRLNFGSWQRSLMTDTGNGNFTGEIPPLAPGGYAEYYIEAVDMGGMTLTHPWAGAGNPHNYTTLGSDIMPPTLDHVFLMDQRLQDWPPTVRARATDNVGIAGVEISYSVSGGLDQGPYPLNGGGESYELDFPLDPSGLVPGDVVTYRLMATDASDNANTTESGPYDFEIVDLRTRVLVIDDLSEHKSNEDGSGAEPGGDDNFLVDKTFQSPLLIAGWLTDAGYPVDMILSSQVVEGSLAGYPVVVLSSGQSFYPVLPDELRAELINYESQGGRLLIEGGETAYNSGIAPVYPDFLEKVLHTSEVLGEGAYLFHPTPGNEYHAFLHRPNPLPDTLYLGIMPGGIDYRVSDMVQPTVDAGLLYSGSFTSTSGGILFHDDNTGPDQGQVLFFPFSINFFKDSVGRMLVENAMAYLLTEELPGRSSITGQVLLSGESDHSGITVSTDSLHTTVTDASGNYTLEGLWGGDVVLTASRNGYGSESQDIFLVDDQIYPADTMTLSSITVWEYENTTSTPIPDNDPDGVDSSIEVTAGGALHDLQVTVDISHYSINNLTVTLTNPAGTSVTLHNRSGGTADDLVGSWPDVFTVDGPGALDDFKDEEVLGAWTLNVADHQFGAIGTLNSWGLTLEVKNSGPTPAGGNTATATRILGNSPNPFNPRTVISFDLARTGPVNLDIYDLRGRLVRTLVESNLPAGRHQVTWDGLDRNGQMSASGVYFTKLRAGGDAKVNKMTLVR
jgi:subtilisin-like proprotein convertase family protein